MCILLPRAAIIYSIYHIALQSRAEHALKGVQRSLPKVPLLP